jgi:serine/threonine protein kinase
MARADEPKLETTEKSPTFLRHKEGYTIQDYRLLERIGEGSFGEVWRAERGGFPVALKILKTSMSSDETQRELKSLETLKKLHHKYLLHTENFWTDGDRLFIEMELADGGTLKDRLKAYQAAGRRGIPEDELLKYCTEIAKALDYLHGHRPVFLHRDIKPANILLVNGCAKVADFGLLRQVAGDNSSTKTQGGTFPYMAPESIKEDKFGVLTDLFSFAVMYAELRQGELPFSGKNQYQICDKILRDPPELSDIFDPEERKVLLKALDKDPRQRFASCGDFVFELNRVVPWTPALEVPALTPAAPTPDRGSTFASNAKTTDPKALPPPPDPVEADLGTARKKSPRTLQEIEVPPEPVVAPPTAPTVSVDDGTVINAKAPRAPHIVELPPAAQTLNLPKPAPETKEIKIAPVRPSGRGNLVKILVPAAIVAVLMGVWFFLNLGAKGEIRGLIEKREYAKAAAKLEDTSRLVVPSPGHLSKEIEEKWWAELTEPGPDASAEALKKSLREVDDFRVYFPDHEGYEPRRAGIVRALAALDSRDNRNNKKDAGPNNQAHQALLDAYASLRQARDYAGLRGKLDEIRDFRKTQPGRDWQPTMNKLRGQVVDDLQNEAWRALLKEQVDTKACRQRLKEASEFAADGTLDSVQAGNLAALQAVLAAFEAPKAGWNQALANLTKVVPANNRADDVGRNLWRALLRLDVSTSAFRFEDLEAFEKAPPPVSDPVVKDANAELLARVLQRLIEKERWFPADVKQSEQCVIWCDRIAKPSDWVKALKVECLAKANRRSEAAKLAARWPGAGWYGDYVEAYALESNASEKLAAAVERLAAALQADPKVLTPSVRRTNAARIFQAAVATLKRTGKDGHAFADPIDAKKAIVWLELASDLAGQAPPEKAIADFAFAAVKTSSAAALVKRAEKWDDASKFATYAWLGKATLAEGKAEAEAFGYFDDALKVPVPVDLHKALAAEAAEQALQLARTQRDKSAWDQAIKSTAACQKYALEVKKTDLVTAARLNGDAVRIHATAAARLKGNNNDEYYRILDEPLAKGITGYEVPVAVARLEFAGKKKSHLAANIEAGETARALAQKLAGAKGQTPQQRQYWEMLQCQCLVYLADARGIHLSDKIENKLLDQNTDREKIIGEYVAIRDLYERARALEHYPERWGGELPFKIGYFYNIVDRKEEALKAHLAFLESLEMMDFYPEQPVVRNARDYVQQALRDLNEKYFKTGE